MRIMIQCGDSGYTIFYMSINIGSVLGFLICGGLGEKLGWHWGFGAAGFGMAFGAYQFIKYRHLLVMQEQNPMI